MENDDRRGYFCTADLLPLHRAAGVPIVFDYLHHALLPGGLGEEEALLAALDTWPAGVRPVVHYRWGGACRRTGAARARGGARQRVRLAAPGAMSSEDQPAALAPWMRPAACIPWQAQLTSASLIHPTTRRACLPAQRAQREPGAGAARAQPHADPAL